MNERDIDDLVSDCHGADIDVEGAYLICTACKKICESAEYPTKRHYKSKVPRGHDQV